MDKFDICIVGAGAVGLGLAYQLTSRQELSGRSVLIIEQESSFGQHTSSRNSEVIHAGIYYPRDSLKATLCVRGKRLLYDYCKTYQVPHRKIGKYIVAQESQLQDLEALRVKAAENGVSDLQWIEKSKLAQIEPEIRAEAALFSPSTGIIDSHSYMQSLLQQAERQGALLATRTRVIAVEPKSGKFIVETLVDEKNNSEHYRFSCSCLINSAGLYAQELAGRIHGFPSESIPDLKLCKGDYFAYTGKSPIRHLIYPMPDANTAGLGIHATLDLSNRLRFGPNVEYVNQIDYDISPVKADDFARAVSDYFPGISADKLEPAYSGIRPKLAGPGLPARDFVIHDGADNGMIGLIQLFGMESPALTSNLAIGEYVTDMILPLFG